MDVECGCGMGPGGNHFTDVLDSPTLFFFTGDETDPRSDLPKVVWLVQEFDHSQYDSTNSPESYIPWKLYLASLDKPPLLQPLVYLST